MFAGSMWITPSLRRASSIVRKSSNSTGYAGNRVARS